MNIKNKPDFDEIHKGKLIDNYEKIGYSQLHLNNNSLTKGVFSQWLKDFRPINTLKIGLQQQ